ncbi:MAG: DUF1587 domain-containing protein, partial [Planctomycetales bacterium]|nr:DUF1587 domain-containing protein [Planctomycetales bacterium]
MTAKLLISVSAVSLVWAAGLVAAAEEKGEQKQKEAATKFLQEHCIDCHSGDKPKGKLALDKLTADFDSDASRKTWLGVQKRIRAGEMPPKDEPRPEASEVTALADWIQRNVNSAEAVRRATQGRVVLRRLNRAEYENTICDLLGIKVPLREQLPEDGSADGFD